MPLAFVREMFYAPARIRGSGARPKSSSSNLDFFSFSPREGAA
jgi:hypothetical protein